MIQAMLLLIIRAVIAKLATTSFTPVRNEADLIRSRGQPVSFLVRLCNETGGVLLTQG